MDNNTSQVSQEGQSSVLDVLKIRLTNAAEIQLLPVEIKREIGKLYEILATAAIGASDANVKDGVEIERCRQTVEDNMMLFQSIINPIFYALVKSAPSEFFGDADKLKLSVIEKKTNYVYKLFKTLNNFNGYPKTIGLTAIDNFQVGNIGALISMMNTPESDYDPNEDDLFNEGDAKTIKFDGLDETDEGDDEAITDEDLEDTDKPEEKPTDTITDLDQSDKSLKEYEDKVMKIFGGEIKRQVSALVATLDTLYGSGLTSLGQFGLLVNNEGSSPIIKLSSSGGTYEIQKYEDELAGTDYRILNIISQKFPEFKSKATPKDCILSEKAIETGVNKESVPQAKFFMDNNAVCYRLHAQWQSANTKFSTGLTSIRKYLTETYGNADTWLKENNGGSIAIRSYKEVKKWYAWSIRRIFIKTLQDLNFVPAYGADQQLIAIIRQVSKNLRNVIVINERDENREEFRLSTDSTVDTDVLKAMLESGLNIGSSATTIVKDVKTNNNVVSFTVVYNQEEENKANLFAAEVIDRMIDSGSKPSWAHALLGKDLKNGGYFFWDGFMDPDKAAPADRCYTIYAASRSGKGVMTSTLVASALCDGKQVFYTDGKPENGVALGEIAWKAQREAYVFNGTDKGKDPYAGDMEVYTHDMRTTTEIADYIGKLPKCLFENKDYFDNVKQAKFLGLMRYLKSLSLCASTIERRASGELVRDNWQIWIFDEVTEMSSREKDIREIFYNYCSVKGVKTSTYTNTSTKKIYFKGFKSEQDVQQYITEGGEKYDAGVAYIYKWNKWLREVTSIIKNAAVISLGKADLNLLFIFQEPSWIATDGPITSICEVIKSLKSTKIAGRGAIPREAGQAAGEYGDATMRQDWITEVDNGGGKWVISHGSNIKQSKVSLFRPYNVYTKYLGKGPNNPMHYLDGYVTHLLGKFGLDPADIIESAYTYAENTVTTLGLAGSLKEFMYDCTNFANIPVSSQYSELVESLENGETDTLNTGFADDIMDAGGEAQQGQTIPLEQQTQQGQTGQMPVNPAPDPRKQISANLNMLPFKVAQQFSADPAVMNKLRDRINKEFVQQSPKFNLFNRNKEQLSLVHLCWNISIWVYMLGIGEIPRNVESSIARFCVSYMDILKSGQAAPDFIPPNEMVVAMLSDTVSGQREVAEAIQNGATTNPVNYEMSTEAANEMEDNMRATMEAPVPVTQNNIGQDGENHINTQAPQTQLLPIIELTDFNSIQLTQPYNGGWLERMLTRTEKGRSQIFENAVQAVIGAIDNQIPDRAAVTRIKAHNNELLINGMLVNLTPLFTKNDYGLRFEDVVNLKTLLNTYKRVEKLDIDVTMFDQLVVDYGDTAQDLWVIFTSNSRLREITYQAEVGAPFKTVTRESYASQAGKIQTEAKKRKHALQIGAIANLNNPRLSEEGVGVVSGSYKIAKTMGNQFVTKMTQDNPQVFRGVGYGMLATMAIGFTAAGALIKGVFGLAGKISKKM